MSGNNCYDYYHHRCNKQVYYVQLSVHIQLIVIQMHGHYLPTSLLFPDVKTRFSSIAKLMAVLKKCMYEPIPEPV